MMATNLRVHIAAVGFEFKRVTEPLLRLHADKVYLVAYNEDDNAKYFMDLIKNELQSKYSHIIFDEEYLDIWNLYDCIDHYRRIIKEEKQNHIYINVSTGTKITAIAGMISCMLWNATPYYAKVNYPDKRKFELPSEHVEEPDMLPTYGINKPDQKYISVLKILSKKNNVMTKSDLIAELENMKLIRQLPSTKQFTDQAKHGQLRSLLDPMEYDWKYVTIRPAGRTSEVKLTEQGKNALRIFGEPELS